MLEEPEDSTIAAAALAAAGSVSDAAPVAEEAAVDGSAALEPTDGAGEVPQGDESAAAAGGGGDEVPGVAEEQPAPGDAQ